MDGYQVISNPFSRKQRGGRPAIMVNTAKYNVENITPSVGLPWTVEACWAVLTLKNTTNSSKIKRIIVASYYCQPGIKRSKLLYDHMSDTYHSLCAKYKEGTYFLLAADSNQMELSPILSLNPEFKQVVKDFTRMDPPRILDTIVTNLSNFYQAAECIPPLDVDPDKQGTRSDHNMVIYSPLDGFNPKVDRSKKTIIYKPYTDNGFREMEDQLRKLDWGFLKNMPDVNNQLESFHHKVLNMYDECFPTKTRVITVENEPWFNEHLGKMRRRKRREFNKHRRSEKYLDLDRKYRVALKKAKQDFHYKKISKLKSSGSKQWWRHMNKLMKSDNIDEDIQVEVIKDLSKEEQVEEIAKFHSRISQEYEPLDANNINIPHFTPDDIPVISVEQVLDVLKNMNINKAGRKDDIPMRIFKHFAQFFCKPIAFMINNAIKQGSWPKFLKTEKVTPIPKISSPKVLKDLRCISGLMSLSKIMEKLICPIVLEDMKANISPSQFAGQKGLSTEHLLVKLLDNIMKALENKEDSKAVILSFLDWESAFPRVSHNIGVQAFVDCGVRGSLMPLIISYFQDRSMKVQWNGATSSSYDLPASTPQGSSFGVEEFLAVSNDVASCVPDEEKFSYMDDLTAMEIVNLVCAGLASYNVRSHVSSSVPSHNQIIPAHHLKTQGYLEEINDWTDSKQMKLNEKKTKTMIINFSKKHKFTTDLKLKGETLEIVDEYKALGVILSSDLKWEANTKRIVRNANIAMKSLHIAKKFTSNISELKQIYISKVRSHLEYGVNVWNSGLTKHQSFMIERVQRSAMKVIFGKYYLNYVEALKCLNLDTLEKRRKKLNLNFAKKCLKLDNMTTLFPLRDVQHDMDSRNKVKFVENRAKSVRYKNSSVPYMQSLLNEDNLHQVKLEKLLLNDNCKLVNCDLCTQ